MNRKIYKVIKGYSELSYDERTELKELIKQHDQTNQIERRKLLTNLSESAGPIDRDSCPCCGR